MKQEDLDIFKSSISYDMHLFIQSLVMKYIYIFFLNKNNT